MKDVSFFSFRGFGYKMGFCEGCFIKHSSLKYMFRRSASLVVKFMSKCEIGVVSTQVTYIAAVIVIWEASDVQSQHYISISMPWPNSSILYVKKSPGYGILKSCRPYIYIYIYGLQDFKIP